MRTEHHKAIHIHHALADVKIKPTLNIRAEILKALIKAALDCYEAGENIPAHVLHEETNKRHGDNYQTPGYFLRLYRLRCGMTQTALAEQANIKQHHLSEMEHNKRPIGKKLAHKLADILNFDYRDLL